MLHGSNILCIEFDKAAGDGGGGGGVTGMYLRVIRRTLSRAEYDRRVGENRVHVNDKTVDILRLGFKVIGGISQGVGDSGWGILVVWIQHTCRFRLTDKTIKI